MATGPTLVSPLTPHLQGGLLSLGWVLLAVLSPSMLLPAVVLLLLRLLLLLLEAGGVGLEHDAVHRTAQGVLRARGDGVHHRGRRHSMLLPRLRHTGSGVGIQFGG